MSYSESRDGVVYTETVVFAPPEQYAADAPYQLAIIDLDNGGRLTVRILANEAAERARVGDKVLFVEERDGVAYYRKLGTPPVNAAPDSRPLV
ncbi:MAG: OB-fold domain-containing protein [Acidobacteriaceae bacterium]|nr:OB-fold domain-containing protein [Acidobacteriaceae bacterium]